MDQANPTRASQIDCEKCKTGAMHATTTARFSGALRVIGYSLLIPSVLLLLLTSGCAVVSCGSVATTTAKQAEASKAELSAALTAIDGLEPGMRETLLRETDPQERDYFIAKLPQDQRTRVEHAFSMYNAALTGATLGTGAAGLIGTVFFVGAYAVLIPLLITGFVLTLSKKVWRCNHCGYIYDRA